MVLGEAAFNSASAEVDPTWYDPMRQDAATVYEGFGANAGQTRTVTHSSGELVAGVKTIKRHTVETGLLGTTEDLWIAFDSQDNARVLKWERAGTVIFAATAAETPPLYLPSTATDGQSWAIAGTTVTIEWVAASQSGDKMKINYVEASGATRTDLLEAGQGVHTTSVGVESGWRLKPSESAN